MSYAPEPAVSEEPTLQSEALSFVHFKEPRNYTRFKCTSYFAPPPLVGTLGDIFLTGTDATAWVRGHQGWALADKTLDDKGVPKQVHPDYLGYIRLDPVDSEWKSTWDFRPKPARKRKQPPTPTEEQTNGATMPTDTTSVMELLVAMKDCQERTVAELVALKDDHARTKTELETVKNAHARTKFELDALKEDHMGTKAELEHAKANIKQASQEVHSLKAELTLSNVEMGQSKASIQLANSEIQGLKAQLTSPGTRLTPMDTNGNISELKEVKSKLKAVEDAIQDMRSQLASTSASLDALIASRNPQDIKDDLYYDDLKRRIRAMLDDDSMEQ